MAAVTVSANLDKDTADRLRSLAQSEHRSVSNLIAAAVLVFSDLPKTVRDALLESRVHPDKTQFRDLARQMEAAVARQRFDRATAALAGEARFDPALADVSEIELLEAATDMCGPGR